MVMRDIDKIDDFIQELVEEQEKFDPIDDLDWMRIQIEIEVCEELYYWLVDEKWKQKEENKKPN